jgi:hypothetical protein
LPSTLWRTCPPGVEKVYDRHHYLPEKRDAFEKLAELVERIVSPSSDKWYRLPAECAHYKSVVNLSRLWGNG